MIVTANADRASPRRLASATLAVVLLGCHPAPAATGSADASSVDAAAATAEDTDADVDASPDYRPYPHGGLTMFIATSLHMLAVPGGKGAQIQRIQRDLGASVAPVRAAERRFVTTLAEGVTAGKVDATAVDAAIVHFKSVAEASRGPSAEAINQLHAALTPAERVALTGEMQARWQTWRSANSANPLGVGAGASEQGAMGRLERFAGGQFGLSPDQLERIRAGLRATEGMPDESDTQLASDLDVRLQAFQTAFVRNSFDAGSLTADKGADADAATEGSIRMARFFEVAAPVLSPDQRAELSAHLRDRYGNFQILRPIGTEDPFGYFETP